MVISFYFNLSFEIIAVAVLNVSSNAVQIVFVFLEISDADGVQFIIYLLVMR